MLPPFLKHFAIFIPERDNAMLQKIAYIGLHYALLMVLVFASWGIGKTVLPRTLEQARVGLVNGLAIALGLGIFICLLQWLGIAGKLQSPWVVSMICVGGAAGCVQMRKMGGIRCMHGAIAAWKQSAPGDRRLFLIVALIAATTLFAPLGPPLEADELSFHLPNAQQWAITGHIGINEWLRYPWFPNNYGLLYSAALLVGSDILPHLVHACAGWLVAFLIYQTGKRYTTHSIACLGVIIWFYLTRRDFDNAYIDMGNTLFVFTAAITFHHWIENKQERTWLLIAAFFAGVAAGCKYQTLGFLPLFAATLIFFDRKHRVLLLVAACFLIPCIYWYARNLILTGDPFNPIGGKIFGFSNWNADDYMLQFQDLKNRAAWPSAALWTALAVPFIQTYRNRQSMRHAMIFCAYALFIWWISSSYPRYLMPAYPVLALLAASGWLWLGSQGLHAIRSEALPPRLINAAWNSLLIVVFIAVSFNVGKGWRRIAPSETIRNEILNNKVPGYQMLSDLKKHPVGRTYQFGVGESAYYAPNPIWGDYFGPWRYSDFAPLQPGQLANTLKTHNFSHLLVNTKTWPNIASRPGFDEYFDEIRSDGDVKLYHIMDK